MEKCESVWDLLSNDVKHFLPQTLFQRCEKLRPLLFRLASETVDDDEALGKSQDCPWIFWGVKFIYLSFDKWGVPFH